MIQTVTMIKLDAKKDPQGAGNTSRVGHHSDQSYM